MEHKEQKQKQKEKADSNKNLNLQGAEYGNLTGPWPARHEDVEKSEWFLAEIQKIAHLGTYVLNIETGRWTSSDILNDIFGIDAAYDKSVASWASIVHPEWQQIMTDYFANEVIGNKDKFDKEYKIIRQNDQEERWVHGLGELLFNEADQPVKMIGTIRDITERKCVEETLQNERLLLRTLIDNIPDSIYSKDLSCRKTLANLAEVRFMGAKSEKEVLGKSDFDFYPKELAEKFFADDQSVIQTGRPVLNREEYILDEKGQKRWLLSSKLPLRDKNNQIIGLVGIGRDITGHKQVEEKLIIAEERTEESTQLKKAFLDNISHEIRTPFSGILGFLSILQNEGLTGSESDEYLSSINQSSSRLMNTISDIVEISQIQTGQMKLTMSETSIKSMIGSLLGRYLPEAENKGLRFAFTNRLPDTIEYIHTDSVKLNTILANLIGNALKFTAAGSIEVDVHLVEKGENGSGPAELEFSIKDTGIGIPEYKHQAIFEQFIQADASTTRQFEGSGLGLSIAKAYAEMLGGKIWVESEEGKGSTFRFTIPCHAKPLETAGIENIVTSDGPDDQMKALKILIAEDDEGSAYLITMAVKMFGKEVIRVRTGVEAVEACRNNSDIDLVMMDIKMPEMDGDEATRQIRKFNTDVVIIAQTAYAMTVDRKMALEAGCNDYITKPIKKDNIVVLVNNYFKNKETER